MNEVAPNIFYNTQQPHKICFLKYMCFHLKIIINKFRLLLLSFTYTHADTFKHIYIYIYIYIYMADSAWHCLLNVCKAMASKWSGTFNVFLDGI